MVSVQQTGNVTPGHLATWATTGVIQDGGAIAAAARVLATQFGANFNTIADQPLLINPAITAFQLTSIIITNASVSLTTAVGGFYPAASKGGTPIVSASQAYSSLTSKDLLLAATITTYGQTTRFSADNLSVFAGTSSLAIYLSLTPPQGAPATADVYLIGMDLSP